MAAVHCFMLLFTGVFFGSACCLILISIVNVKGKNDLKLINEKAASDRNRLTTLNLITDFVETHSFLKRLSVYFVLSIS